jgi:putative transposase
MHVIQRGVNRCAVFVDDGDRRHYLHLLADGLRGGPIALHAFALMGNHVHLLLTPGEVGAAAALMRRLGQSYVAGFNRRHGRCGPLWQDRFRSCLIDTRHYLLSVYRYIDLNPVRAGLVLDPVDYGWSSAPANLGVRASTLPLVPHPEWLCLAGDPASRHAAYRRFLDDGVGSAELAAIRTHVAQQRAYGSTGFQAMVERTLGHPARCRPVGRPALGAGPGGGAERGSPD